MMKRLFTAGIVVLALFAGSRLAAQAVTVVPATEFVGTGEKKGIQTALYIDEKHVTKGWKEFLKAYGKTESPKGTKNVYNVPLAKMPNVSFMPVDVSSKITAANGATTVFMAAKLDSGFATDAKHPKYAQMRELLLEFGRQMYRDQVAREADDAQKELDKRVRTHSQLVRKGEGLQKDVEQNAKDKVSFEEQLARNKADSVRLVNDMAANKNRLAQTGEALEKQRNMMATLKESLTASGIDYSSKKKKDMPPELVAAEKELKEKDKENDKAIREAESLRKDAERNLRQKSELYAKLAKNAADKTRLPRDIEANLREQKAAQQEVEKQQKAVEQVKAKLGEIK